MGKETQRRSMVNIANTNITYSKPFECRNLAVPGSCSERLLFFCIFQSKIIVVDRLLQEEHFQEEEYTNMPGTNTGVMTLAAISTIARWEKRVNAGGCQISQTQTHI